VQPYAPPAAPYPGPPRNQGPSGRAPLGFELTEVLSGAWNVFARHWMALCTGLLVVGCLVGVPLMGLYVVGVLVAVAGSSAVASHGGPDPGTAMALAMLGLLAGAIPIIFLLTPIFAARLLRMSLTAVRGGTPAVGDLFRGETRYGAMLALMLLQGLLIGLGYLLFIVPGVILAIGLYFSAFLVVDQRMGAVDAMKASWELTRGRKGEVFGTVLVFGLVAAGCGLVPLVGHFVGYALMMLGMSIVYLRLMGEWAPVLPPPAPYPGAPYGGYPPPYGQQPPYGPAPGYGQPPQAPG
jgi:hypothetical protein